MILNTTRLRAWLYIARFSLLSAAWAVAITFAVATGGQAQSGKVIVIRSDRGGLLAQRSAEIRDLRATGQRVELRGTCLSACTMYLGLPNACVSPSATFGFHGPSWYGNDLSAHEFEHWSLVMAQNYQEPLRTWFMTQARYHIRDYYRISGAELIRLGYQKC